VKKILVVACALSMTLALAPSADAALQTSWRTGLAGGMNDVAVGPGGAIYVVGQGPAGAKPYERAHMTLSRVTPSGDVVWTRRWQPHPERPKAFLTNGRAVAVSTSGIVYVAGTVQRFNCEGGGWFVRAYGPNGRFLSMTGTRRAWYCKAPGPQTITDVAVGSDLVVVAAAKTGCCGEGALVDGYVRGYTRTLKPMWRSDFEPPAPAKRSWFDVPDSVAIAANGAVYAAGWAATRFSTGESTPPGAMLVEKYGHAGASLWTKRPGVPLRGTRGVSLELLADRMVVGADLRGGGIWLGALSLTASPLWHRAWGADTAIKAMIGAVAVDANGAIWVAGTRRDPNGGTNPFVRRYNASGTLRGTLTIDEKPKRVYGNSVDTLGTAGFAVGTRVDPATYRLLRGQVWRVNS
jgi:hypothetical protein